MLLMALRDELLDDFEFVDWTESVSFYDRTAEGTFATAQTVRGALRRAVTREEVEAAGGGKLARAGLAWHLWVKKLGSTVPKKQDVIQDAAGDRWTVLSVDTHTLRTRYRCVCVKER